MKGYTPDLTKTNIELNSKIQKSVFIELGAIQETEQCDCEDKSCCCKN